MEITLTEEAVRKLQQEDARGFRSFLKKLNNAQKDVHKVQFEEEEAERNVRFNLFIDKEMHTQLSLLARQEDRSIQRQIIHILKQAINR